MRMFLALALVIGLAGFASAQVPTVSVIATDARAVEATKDPGTFAITHSGEATGDLTVHYSIEGTAKPGEDYPALPGTVVIPAGTSTMVITVMPTQDKTPEKPETVILTLTEDPAYRVGEHNSATITIRDK
jgi:Calx-beta domain